MSVRSHVKGAAYERYIAKQLSLWVSSGKTDACFWRTSMSGGRATLALADNKSRVSQAGDISSISRTGDLFLSKFIVELKHYKDLQLKHLLTCGNGNIVRFWQEAQIDARKYKKQPLLIAKENYVPDLFCISNKGLSIFSNRRHMNSIIQAKIPRLSMNIILLDDFLKKIKPSEIKRN